VINVVHTALGVLVIGGSAADDGVLDQKLCWVAGCCGTRASGAINGVVVTLLWPSVRTSTVFSHAYDESDNMGEVTAAEGRVLKEINGIPAAVKYAEWSNDASIAAKANAPRNILASTTLHPLGKKRHICAQNTDDMDGSSLTLIHPEAVLPDGSLRLFAPVSIGDTVVCMKTTVAELDSRTDKMLYDSPCIGQSLGALLV